MISCIYLVRASPCQSEMLHKTIVLEKHLRVEVELTQIVLLSSGSQLAGRDPKLGHRPASSGSWYFAWEENAQKKLLCVIHTP